MSADEDQYWTDPRLDELSHPAYSTPLGATVSEMVADGSILDIGDYHLEGFARVSILGRRGADIGVLDAEGFAMELTARARTALLFYFDTFGEPAGADSQAWSQATHARRLSELVLDPDLAARFEAILPGDLRERIEAEAAAK